MAAQGSQKWMSRWLCELKITRGHKNKKGKNWGVISEENWIEFSCVFFKLCCALFFPIQNYVDKFEVVKRKGEVVIYWGGKKRKLNMEEGIVETFSPSDHKSILCLFFRLILLASCYASTCFVLSIFDE